MKRILLTNLFIIHCFLAFSQSFTPGNLVISRYGDGIKNLPSDATAIPVFLDEYDLSGNKIQSMKFPVVKSEQTRNRVLTGGVTGNGQGLLTLSPNGQYLVTIGFNVEPGDRYGGGRQKTAGIVTSDGHMNIFTAVRPNIGTPRCAITNNGYNLWVAGSGGGVKYKSKNTGFKNDEVISRSPSAHNAVYIYNDQLYYTSNYKASPTGPKIGVVGDGLPNEGLQTVTNLPGFPTNSAPGQMVMLDYDTDSPEPDLLYVNDLQKGELQKWVFDGQNWQAQGALAIEGVTNQINGLTGDITSGNVVLYTNTSDAVIKFNDSDAISSTLDDVNAYDILATAPENTIFTGVAFTPGTVKKTPKKVTSSSNFAELIQEETNLITTVTRNETYHPYPGVEEMHLSYISNRGVPVALFFLKVNLKNPNATIEALTPYDDTEFARQTVRTMIRYKNESESERQVVAASNGDYFHWTGEPDGAVHKDGVIIKEIPDLRKYFFGIKNDGTALIGDKRIYDHEKQNLKEVISGRFFLMHYGEIMTDHLLDTSIEPRTTVGILSPEHVVFMWVDGRRAGHSAGLSLRDMASIYDAIGAKEAINLDGGGSTTFLMREKNGNYVAHNRPSDASGERSVGNGLAVMMKSEILETGSSKKNATKHATDVFLYPSPVEDHVNIFIEKENGSQKVAMSLTNSNGHDLLNVTGSMVDINEELNRELSNLEKGVYIIKITGEHGTYSSRLMKK